MYMFMVAAALFLMYNSGLLESKSSIPPTIPAKPEKLQQEDVVVVKDADIRNPKWKGQKSPHSFNMNQVSRFQFQFHSQDRTHPQNLRQETSGRLLGSGHEFFFLRKPLYDQKS